MTPISFREKEVVLSFLTANAKDGLFKKPIPHLANLLLETFGWPLTSGRKRASIIMRELADSKTILLNGQGSIKSVLIPQNHSSEISAAKQPSEPLPTLINPKTVPGSDNTNLLVSGPYPCSKNVRHQKLKKGAARRNRERINKGDRNEQRLYSIANELLSTLSKRFPSVFLETSCARSGRHSPRKGKIDLQDKSGEDISLKLTVRSSSGHLIAGRVIYDAKSSQTGADKFNRHIHLLPGQSGALMKKAIIINERRSNHEIISELADDLIKTELMPQDLKEKVLSFFPEC